MNQELLDIRKLQAFRALASRKSFTRAARDLFRTQSAVSHAISSLESDLGCRLFDRLGKNVQLTEAGEILLQQTYAVFDALDAARTAIAKHRNEARLRIGGCSVGCQTFLPRVISLLSNQVPGCMVSVNTMDSSDVFDALFDDRIDVAIALQSSDSADLAFEELYTDSIRLVMPPGSPSVSSDLGIRSQIESEPFVFYNRTSCLSQLIERFLVEEGITMPGTIEVDCISMVKQLVALGTGVSILPSRIIQSELASGALTSIAFEPHALVCVWGVSRRKGRQMSAIEETFVELCRAVAARGIAAGESLSDHLNQASL